MVMVVCSVPSREIPVPGFPGIPDFFLFPFPGKNNPGSREIEGYVLIIFISPKLTKTPVFLRLYFLILQEYIKWNFYSLPLNGAICNKIIT